ESGLLTTGALAGWRPAARWSPRATGAARTARAEAHARAAAMLAMALHAGAGEFLLCGASPVEIFRLGSLVQRQGRVGISRRQPRPRFLRALGRSLLPEFLGQLYELRGLRPNRLPGRRACFELLADDAGQGLRSLGELTHDLLDARIGPTPRGPSPRKA